MAQLSSLLRHVQEELNDLQKQSSLIINKRDFQSNQAKISLVRIEIEKIQEILDICEFFQQQEQVDETAVTMEQLEEKIHVLYDQVDGLKESRPDFEINEYVKKEEQLELLRELWLKAKKWSVRKKTEMVMD
jgi:hypothetical protein